jgi:Amt family ammonium transporter
MLYLKKKRGLDDSLDVFAVHGVGGIWGALATGIFATAAIGGADGLLAGNGTQFLIQLAGVGAVGAFAFGGSWLLGKAVDVTMGLRVKELEEEIGLDISQHGERAYGGIVQ